MGRTWWMTVEACRTGKRRLCFVIVLVSNPQLREWFMYCTNSTRHVLSHARDHCYVSCRSSLQRLEYGICGTLLRPRPTVVKRYPRMIFSRPLFVMYNQAQAFYITPPTIDHPLSATRHADDLIHPINPSTNQRSAITSRTPQNKPVPYQASRPPYTPCPQSHPA